MRRIVIGLAETKNPIERVRFLTAEMANGKQRNAVRETDECARAEFRRLQVKQTSVVRGGLVRRAAIVRVEMTTVT
mgnify:CR=1 FL=1